MPHHRRTMTTTILKKILIGLGAVAALSSIAAGGTGLAIYEQNPHFGGTSFIAVSGKTPRNDPEISVSCSQNGKTVKSEKASAKAGGAYFTWSDTNWPSGGATCTAKLLTTDRKGTTKVLASLLFPVSG
jgi:hypothetical protein